MKIVNIGDLLLPEKFMDEACRKYPRYDVIKNFHFGADTRTGHRDYQTRVEHEGSECVPMADEILKEIEDADVIQVHFATIPAKAFDVAKNLKLVITNRAGCENVNLEAAEAHGVPVISNPAHNANSVAEFTIGMILAETRNIARCHANFVQNGTWREIFPNTGTIRELGSMTVGLIGFGNIARLVTQKLSGFGTKVIASDPFVDEETMAKYGVKKVTQDEVMSQSDVVSVHLQVTPATKGLIGAREIALMKPTATLVVVSRSAVVDTQAVADALKAGKIMGAAYDVFDQEPISRETGHPFLGLDNVTLTSHQAGVTMNAFDDSPAMVMAEAERFFNGEVPKYLRTSKETLKKYVKVD